MAENKKENAKMEFPLQIARQYPAPIDAHSMFYSLAEAEGYAENSPLAYAGQVLTVVDENAGTIELYKIKTNRKLENFVADEVKNDNMQAVTSNAVYKFVKDEIRKGQLNGGSPRSDYY